MQRMRAGKHVFVLFMIILCIGVTTLPQVSLKSPKGDVDPYHQSIAYVSADLTPVRGSRDGVIGNIAIEGEWVASGETMASLGTESLDKNIVLLGEDLKSSRDVVGYHTKRMERLERDIADVLAVYQGKDTSKQAFSQAQDDLLRLDAALNYSLERLFAANDRIEKLSKKMRLANDMRDASSHSVDFASRVVERFVSRGDRVSKDDILLHIAGEGDEYVIAYIPKELASGVRKGDKLVMQSADSTERFAQGVVGEILTEGWVDTLSGEPHSLKGSNIVIKIYFTKSRLLPMAIGERLLLSKQT